MNPTDRVNEVLKAFGNNKDVVVISNHLNAGGGEFNYHYKEMIGY